MEPIENDKRIELTEGNDEGLLSVDEEGLSNLDEDEAALGFEGLEARVELEGLDEAEETLPEETLDENEAEETLNVDEDEELDEDDGYTGLIPRAQHEENKRNKNK